MPSLAGEDNHVQLKSTSRTEADGAQPVKDLHLDPGKELVLDVKNRSLGSLQLFLSEKGARIVSLSGGANTEVVALPPTWKVVMYRPQTKLKWTTELSGFSEAIYDPSGFRANSEVLKLPLSANLPKVKRGGFECVTSRLSLPGPVIFTQWWTDTNLPPPAVELVCRYFMLPFCSGKMVVADEGFPKPGLTAEQRRQLEKGLSPNYTSFMSELRGVPRLGPNFEIFRVRQIAFNAAHFKYPIGYTEKSTMYEVLGLEKNVMADMFDQSYVSDSDKKQKK